ncbi:response regulator [Natranaerofaba carboxydovora]|uniref:response regulator n=1 Tax=Natranaerofaba carboxydovora TaxID=2742683 RepID=UPI001F143F38|nr:response regulator transcription factor [Natranaerofaba carboxydovora]UMZ74250.1 Alkaline phosphatase synthesis transcriptional regulatory protein PhoP [Natranaerofaba carboxydovora]
MSEKILLVEDDKHIARLVTYNLEKEGYQVTHEIRGDKAIELLYQNDFDLVVLDIMLPGISGLDFCRKAREYKKEPYLPIIMLTAKNEETDKIVGLEMGANDYVTKPFSPKELTARVKAQLRSKFHINAIENETSSKAKTGKEKSENESSSEINNDEIIVGSLILNPKKYRAKIANILLNLTPKEFELLMLLATSPGQVFTRDLLLEKIWGFDYEGDTRTVDVHIRHIRQKIQETGYNKVIIETVRGVGYRLKEPE